ncbi:uncharacterized protein LOC112090999 isoform X1 [Morus notabilis]|uniref:uncharacterized protein LOC112090999 isoform X1 n=1 Tax=Morus notabilis TaxID=981085 RepID=UPI000CECF609|nr:uncharacterized protein LOC112090999 isoform X1 [Morus notabilis]
MVRFLTLIYNDEKAAIFPFEFIQRFKDLEELSLKGYFVEEICQHQETNALQEPDGPLLHVRALQLMSLRNLRHLFENAENVKPGKAFQNIEALSVYRCRRLNKLVPFLEAFRNMKDLRVSSCNVMTNLLSSSTAKSLVQLTRMSIDDCKQIREIAACKEGETEDEFAFARLRIVVLHNLPSLGSFYSGNAAMRLPLLEKLILSQCSEMRSFSRGIITTQKLNEIFVGIVNADMFKSVGKRWMDRIEYDCVPRKQIWEGDINSTVQKIWEDYSNSRGDSSIEKNIQKSREEAVNP